MSLQKEWASSYRSSESVQQHWELLKEMIFVLKIAGLITDHKENSPELESGLVG